MTSPASALAGEPISSAANPRYRQVRGLIESARDRRRDGATVLEGLHLVDQWLRCGGELEQLYVAASARERAEVSGLLDQIRSLRNDQAPGERKAPLVPVLLADRLFDALGTMPSPVPVLAIVRIPPGKGAPTPGVDTVILDRVQDPANVGAIVRTTAAAGITQLVTLQGSAGCWSPKVLRAGMGGHFALAIHEGLRAADLVATLQLPLAGTVVQGGASLYAVDLRPACAWVFGHEGEGLDPQIEACLSLRLSIPQTAAVESLNVAAAAAICLFEQRRQRFAAG